MPILTLLKLFLSLASSLAEYAKTKQLMEAGANEAILMGIRDADEAINRANSARFGKLPDVAEDSANRDNTK